MTKLHQLFIFLFIVLLDQLSKYFARQLGVVTLNPGVSFGLFDQSSMVIHGLLFVGTIVTLYFLLHPFIQKLSVELAVLMGAGVSNFIDRIVWGGVQDFLFIPILNIKNNLADWLIFVIILGIIWKVSKTRNIVERGSFSDA